MLHSTTRDSAPCPKLTESEVCKSHFTIRSSLSQYYPGGGSAATRIRRHWAFAAIDYFAMHMKRVLSLCVFTLAGLPLSGANVKPESVGLSEERLSRIHETMQRHIDSHDISGAVTLV